MKLRSILSLQTVDNLRRIAARCAISTDGAANKTALIDLLCRSLPAAPSVGRRLSELEAPERAFVTGLAAEGGELLEEAALEELAGGFTRTFRTMLASLSDLGLVFRDTQTLSEREPIVGIPDPILRSIPVPDDAARKLRVFMRSTSIGLLRSFARQLGLDAGQAPRQKLVQAIRAHLLRQETLMQYVAGLSDSGRAILDVFLEEGVTTRAAVHQMLGEGALRELDELLWRTPFIQAPDAEGRGPEERLWLASDLAEAMGRLAGKRGGRLESQPHEVLEASPPSPAAVSDGSQHLQRDLATLIGMIRRRRPRLLKRGGISKGSLREAAGFLLGDEDPGYSEFLMLFAESAGLVLAQGRNWTAVDRAGQKLEDEGRVRKALLTFWLGTDRWNEWTSDRSGSPGPRKRASELIEVRRAVTEGLSHCTVGQWISYSQFYQLLVKTSDTMRAFTEYPGGKGALSSGGTTADELLRRMLRGALAWIGIIQIGNPDDYAVPLHNGSKGAFLLTELGRDLLSGGRPRLPRRTETDAQFTIQPNLEVLSPPDLPYAHYIDLHGLADLRAIDVVARFEISRHSLHEALNRGTSTREIRRFLNARSATGIPEMVQSILDECDSKHGEVEIHASPGFVTVADKGLMDELFAQGSLAELLGERLSPVAAAIRQAAKPEVLFSRLRQAGYLPRQSLQAQEAGEEHHQLVLRSSELAELVGLLEATSTVLAEGGLEVPEDLKLLARRLRRGLRRVPDGQRQQAEDRYGKAFSQLRQSGAQDDGSKALDRFRGQNPAREEGAIRKLVSYAIDHKLWIKIDYPSESAENGAPRTVEPVSEDHAMVYGYCRLRKGDRVFRLDKIRSASLAVPEPAEPRRGRRSG